MGLLPLRHRLILLFAFLVTEATLVSIASLIPATPIPPSSFYGDHLAWSKLFIFVTMIPLGFVFVAALVQRKNPLLSRRGSPKDFILLLAAAVVAFFHCPIRTLHHPTDFLGPSNANLLHPSFPGASQLSSILYNFLCCVLPFFIGLHFRLLDDIPFLNKMFYKVTWPPSVDAYGRSQFLALGFIAILALAIVGFFLFLFYQASLLFIYLGLLAVVVGGLALVTYLLRKTHYLHLHHFFIFGTLYLFTPFQNIPAAIIQGLLLGAAVEGIATWGFEALYIRHRQQVSTSVQSALLPPPQQQLVQSYLHPQPEMAGEEQEEEEEEQEEEQQEEEEAEAEETLVAD